MRWRLKEPPEKNRLMSEGERSNREIVAISIFDYGDMEGAKRRFDDDVKEIGGRDQSVPGLGDDAHIASLGGEDTMTDVAFRFRQYYVTLGAPNANAARRFAWCVDKALRSLEK